VRKLPMRAIVSEFVMAIALALAGASSGLLAEPTVKGPDTAKPPSAELAKKCRALAIKAHPTRPAGSKAGSEQAQRGYFRDCIVKDGNMPE
jgi:hypothetical protein